jgi:hypothetical protein
MFVQIIHVKHTTAKIGNAAENHEQGIFGSVRDFSLNV